MNKVGAHVSAAGSVDKAPDNAEKLGCEVFQFFSRSPRGGGAKPITESVAESFKQKCRNKKMEAYIHAPYYINFASANNHISHGSVSAIQEELQRGSLLSVPYVMTHLGSAKDLGREDAVKQTIKRLKSIYEKYNGTTKLLLENSAGSEGVLGEKFEELAYIIKEVGREDLSICLDTCHLYASGYNITTEEGLQKTIKEFKKNMPAKLLKLVHANDSKTTLGGGVDRHADIGDGYLGLNTFKNIMANPLFKNINFILETPGGDTRQIKDINKLKELRNPSLNKRRLGGA